ncbi:aldehyde dehydrogenase family protein (plasmid) [Sphingomonas sp. LaA6.9]|nr:aldehyde dehydrogenase family protein [Sphingomonas sp. LaA6.9]MCJ8159011.1 aldehyde dehydrogenase family protein [Sphingomonas sp. LaA6.9]
MLDLRHLIAGEWRKSEARQPRFNPSDTDETVARAPIGVLADLEDAVSAARAAFPSWAAASPEVRADCLDRIGSTLLSRAPMLGRLLSREEGKTLAEGIGEVSRAARIFKYFAGEALRRHGQNLDSVRPGVEIQTYRQAVGVIGLITPWNFPIAIPAWKSAPALAFGNAVVMKPASLTPAIAVALAEIMVESGVPSGVFNLVIGPGSIGDALVRHPGIDGVSFTGSQSVGLQVASAAAARQARFQLEMGGKNPLVILDDADLDRAVAVAIDGAFFGTGQRCTASSRLIVAEGVHDKFIAAMAERMRNLRVGHALSADTQIGPAASQAQQEQSYAFIARAQGEGGVLVAGGARITRDHPGWYVEPALIGETAMEMEINRLEVFGPVASVIRVKDYDEALATANAGDFGLSAGIVTSSLKFARHFQKAVRAGMVMTNLPTAGVDYHVPFGGMGRSSFGAREQGFAAIEFYTQTKTAYSYA